MKQLFTRIKNAFFKKKEQECPEWLRQWMKKTGYKNLRDYYEDHREEQIDTASKTLGIQRKAIERALSK